MFHVLPPVGNRILPPRGGSEKCSTESLFEPYKICFFHSGTAALAAAIKIAIARRSHTAPEVLLPAYGCPDLVSAVLHAGAKPILVDLHKNTPWLDHDQLSRKITTRSVAIIGVNFLGIEERIRQLRVIADTADILLIEDSAQYLLDPANDAPARGDLIILSFGRGKPVSLLGGGAVLYRDASFDTDLAGILPAARPDNPGLLFVQCKIKLYNALLSPKVYGLVTHLPFLHIGATRFKPLLDISPMSFPAISGLANNIRHYRQSRHDASKWIGAMLTQINTPKVVDLAHLARASPHARLLRYPLLVTDSDLHTFLYRRLRDLGLGVSRMYPSTLPNIAGLEKIFQDHEAYPHAESFARSILTLPTHQGVTRHHVEKMEEIFLQAKIQGYS